MTAEMMGMETISLENVQFESGMLKEIILVMRVDEDSQKPMMTAASLSHEAPGRGAQHGLSRYRQCN